jgi:heme exporter protein A
MMPPAVRTRALSKRYGARVALAPLDLEVAAGEFLALVGPNGAGKSTLLLLLAALARPSDGQAWLFGHPVERGPGSSAGRRAVGYVGHPLIAYRALSPRQNLEFFGRLYGLPGLEALVDASLARFGLAEQADDPAGSLSRGQQQRLSLARALLHEPPLLLLDEPFNSLDSEATGVLSGALRQASRAGRTVLMATHDLDRARELAGQVAVLRRGHLALRAEAPAGAQAWASLYRRAAGEAGE